MEKRKISKVAALQWFFVGLCLLLCLGMPFGIGTVLMLVSAVIALPVKAVTDTWNRILPPDKPAEEKRHFWQRKKKKQNNLYGMKPLLIALVFMFALLFGIGAMEEGDATPKNDPNLPTVSDQLTDGSGIDPVDTLNPTVGDSGLSQSSDKPEDAILPGDDVLPAGSTFSIHFIDVGQADAALVECDGHYMLIDGGNKADSNVVYTVLKNAGVTHLDIVVGTHAHEDHIGGIPGAFNYASADLTLCPVTSYDSDAFTDFARYAIEKGGGITVPAVGDTYPLGSAEVRILGVNGGSDTNDTSIVLKIQYGDTSFLFAGDAEREAEQAILNSGADLSATVLKVGHHGSDTSTTYPFLREVMPTYAIISVGTGNSYGHPTDDTLSRLRDADVAVYRTDLQGDIFATSDGETVSITTDKAATDEALMVPGSSTTTDKNDSKPSQEPTSEPTADTSPEPSTPSTSNETMVWIPNSGSKYHSRSNCSNMKNPTQVTESQAISMGYTPCKRCH